MLFVWVLFTVIGMFAFLPQSCEGGTGRDGTKLSIEEIRASLEESETGHSGATAEKAEKENTGTAHVTELRHWSNPDYTRVAVMLDREAVYEYHRLKKDDAGKLPPRLYLDIKGARLARGVKDISIGDGLLRMARVAQFRSDVVRVVLDIDTMKDFKIFPLSDPYRIIIDVKGERKMEISSLNESIQNLAPSPPEEANLRKAGEKIVPVPVFKPGKIRRIVIDPGHGGHDPGAIGPSGTREKDVVLDMGLKLAKKIREDLRMDVVMTRSTDIFIPLEERTAIANKVNADLFISVHANASLNKSSSGIETYYLNLAKTEKAKQVAARENNTSLEKVGVLQTILFDLMANHKLNDSARLADDVQSALYRKIGKQYEDARNLGVKQGPFYVLVGATMPSILVETAFVSNEKEEDRLKDPEYQDATVAGIVDGIKAYIAGLK
jgi:N-acetylmuramoyl-L-alanine amidase